MRQIFETSYKSFYFLFIGILWFSAVVLALFQSGYAVEIALKNILPKYGVYIQSASGGALSGVELKGIRYEKLLSASEARCRVEIAPLLSGEISLSYLDVKNLRLDEKELLALINEPSSDEKPELIKAIKAENISVSLINFTYRDVKVPRLSLKSDYVYYNWNNFYLDVKADIKSNIVDAKFHGDILDRNYSVRGEIEPNGSPYIDKLVGDSDFSFNAIKKSDFALKGDFDTLHAKALVKNSGIIYKGIADAKIKNVISELEMDLNTLVLRVDSKGEVDSKYALADSEFSVVYDGNKTSYFGKGRIKLFREIPLGVFKNSLKIKTAINDGVEFAGDLSKVEIKSKNRAFAALEGKRFDAQSLDIDAAYDFDESRLAVSSKARVYTDFFVADAEVKVEDGKELFYEGVVYNFSNISIGVDPSAFDGAKAVFKGDDKSIVASLSSGGVNGSVSSNGYVSYDFDAKLKEVKLLSLDMKPIISANTSGSYDYKKEELAANVKLLGAKIYGKNAVSDNINVKYTPNYLYISDSIIKIGGVEAQVGAVTSKGVTEAKMETGGASLRANGVLNKELKITANGDLAKIAAEYAKITGSKKSDISGTFLAEASIVGELSDGDISLVANFDSINIGEQAIKDVSLSAKKTKDMVALNLLRGSYQNKKYSLSKPAIIKLSNDYASCEDVRVDDLLAGSFVYQNKKLEYKAKIKNFKYEDGSKISFLMDASVNGAYVNKKLNVSGDAYLKGLRIGFEPRGSGIAKDKDIIVLRSKKAAFDEQNFINSVALQLNIINVGEAVYASKDGYAPLELNLLYYKDYGEKPMMLGVIEAQSGRYDFEGKRFYIQPSQIILTQAEPHNPYLEVALKHVDKDREITVYAKEFASAPKLNFSAKPSMSEKEIISYLLFGIDPGDSFTKTGDDAKYSSKAIGALSNALSRDLVKEFGVKLDKIEITPTEKTDAAGKTSKSAKVEIGKKITKDLTVTYKNDVDSSIVFEYQINKNVHIESQAGRKSSIDIFYKQDY